MRPYNIVYAPITKKQVRRIIDDQHKRIKKKIEDTAKDPYKLSSKVKDPNLPARKIRIGNFRVLFDLDDDKREMIIKAIKLRSEVYD